MNKDFYKKNKYIILGAFTVLCFIFYFIWSILKPYNYGPDEYVRFPAYYYMFINNSLPSGYEESIRNPIWGFSYAFYYTWLPGLLSFACMKAVSFFNSDLETLLFAARFPSVIAGALTVFLSFRISDIVLEDEKSKWLSAVFVAFLPQFAFLSSYVNNDIFAIAGAALIVLSLIKLSKNGFKIGSSILIAAGITVVALSYYNTYGYILFAVITLIVLIAVKKKERKDIIKYSVFIALLVLLFTGFFAARNIVLYNGDLFGMRSLNESAEMFAIEELKPSMRDTLKNQGLPLRTLLKDRDYIFSTERSFFAAFAYTNFTAPGFVYKFFRYFTLTGIILFVISFVVNIKKEKRKLPFYLYAAFILSASSVVFLALYYSYATDYEPQGRYILPILPVLMLFVGIGYDLFLSAKKLPDGLKNISAAILTAAYVAVSLYCFFFVYIPSDFPLADMKNLEELLIIR